MEQSITMLTKRSGLFCLFIALSYFLSGQSSLSTDGRWEIGVDFLPLIDTTHFVKNSILVRRVIGDRSKMRARIGVSFKEIKSQERTLVSDADVTSNKPFQGYLSIGYERYLQTGRVSVFIGGDLFATYYRKLRQSDFYSVPPDPGASLTHYKVYDLEHSYRVGLNLLAGVNIRIVPHLYLSTEAFLQTAYRWEKTDYRQYTGADLHLLIHGGRILKRAIVDLEPISAIQLVYQF